MTRTITIELDDIVQAQDLTQASHGLRSGVCDLQFTRDTELATKMETNTKRYEELMKQAIDQNMPMATVENCQLQWSFSEGPKCRFTNKARMLSMCYMCSE